MSPLTFTAVDDYSEHELWKPYYGSLTQPLYNGSQIKYPPRKGHMISSFTGLCKLSIILGTLMLEIYGSANQFEKGKEGPSTSANSKTSAFIRICADIQIWWDELPATLRINLDSLPDLSPPLHIVSLNLLYHTTLILLHRPFILGSNELDNPAVCRSYQICLTAAAGIHDLLDLLTNTFGHGHVSYLNCYCAYTAATVAVFHLDHQEDICQPPENIRSGKLGLKFFLDVLHKTATAMPALTRSVEIIERHMKVIVDRRAKLYLNTLFPGNNQVYTQGTQTPILNTISHPPQAQYGSQWKTANPVNYSGMTEVSCYDQSQLYSGFNLGELPAFPGQNFNVGPEYNLDQEIMDPEMRATLLGLDPHLTLHHGNNKPPNMPYNGYIRNGTQ